MSVDRDVSLESAVCDLDRMTSIACMLMERLHEEQRVVLTVEVTAKQLLNQCRSADDDLTFAVYHVREMAVALRKAFFGKQLQEVT